jgi:hypothetical protein
MRSAKENPCILQIEDRDTCLAHLEESPFLFDVGLFLDETELVSRL